MKKKLFTTYIVLILVAVLTVGIINVSFVRRSYKDHIKDRLISNGNLISESLKIYEKSNSIIDYFLLTQNFSKQTKLQVSFIGEDGTLIADSQDNSLIFNKSAYKNEISNVHKNNNYIKEEFNFAANEEYMYNFVGPIKTIDKNIFIRVGMALGDFNKLDNIFIMSQLISVALSIVVSIVLGYIFLGSIIKPIKELSFAAKKISEGEFDYKVRIKTKDELEELANSFNIMSSKVSSTVNELKSVEIMRKDFVANVSHELKTPITVINGFVDTLKNNLNTKNKNEYRYLDTISIEIQRLRVLIDDLLMLSKLDNINKLEKNQKVNIFKEIDYVITILNPIASKKGVVLDADIGKNFYINVSNKEWFRQMLLNLIENAIKYNKEGTVVNIIAFVENNKGVFIIKDNGIGIPKKDKEKVFERFYRVDKSRCRKYGGTGLGLSIVKNIVIAFDGSISLDSEEGKGCKFTIKIPIE